VSITSTNLGFPEGGRVAELTVKVGDRVQPGQVLARLDDYTAQQMLAQQRAQLAQQAALLGKVRNSTAVAGAEATLAQAQQILAATEDQVDATNSANASAVDRAEAELRFARKQLDQAEQALRQCQATTTPPSALPAPLNGTTYSGPDCSAQESAVSTAKNTVVMKKTALDAAENKQQTDAAAGEVSIENAQQSVVTAQNQLNAASTDRPFDIAAQAAQVRNLQAAVNIAQRDVDDTVLIAPVAGVVSAINGSVGEFVGPTSLATPLAPGTDARIPGVGAVPGGGGGGAGGGGASAGAGGSGAPGAGAFIVLNDVQSFQVVVPFQEADAARVAPNQRVDVTFDAIPDLSRPGMVLAVAPAGADQAGIINYYTTIVLSESDPKLRDGQTADAAVIVQSVDNVLRVPTAAVSREDGRTVVTVRGPDGRQSTVPFEPGLAGDTHIEVLSGLSEGQELLLPQATVQTGATRGPPR
jgi:HlyD family secretion protein